MARTNEKEVSDVASQVMGVVKRCYPVAKGAVARFWPLLLFGVLFVAIQMPLLRQWWRIWNEPYSYFSHGPLIPFIVGYMIWANRQRMKQIPINPSWIGLVVLFAAVIFFIGGHWIQSFSLRAAAFMLMIFGIMLSTLGFSMTRLLTIPVLFLVSMIPTSASILDSATGKLQLQSAAIAAKFLQWTGYSNRLEGVTIFADGLPEPLIVGMPCSGLRTLISLITFTIFFVYMVRAQWWKKAILLALSFPLSIFINSLRITMIGYAGFWTGSASAMHKFHDYSGYIGLLICFAMLFGLAKLIKAGEFGLPVPKANPKMSDYRAPKWVGGGIRGVVVAVLLIIAGLASIYGSPVYPRTKPHLDRAGIPMSFGNWQGEDLPIDDETRKWLEKGDLLSRGYTNSEDGRQVVVFMTAAKDPEAFHDPHMCLPGSGNPITDDRIIDIQFSEPKPLSVKSTVLVSRSAYGDSMVIYWYMIGEDSIARTNEVWHRNRANMLNDLKRLVLHPGERQQVEDEVERRQFHWYRFSTEIWADEETDEQFLIDFAKQFVANMKGFGE